MSSELSSTKRASAAETICKIALRTIPRCGAASLVLLILGLYLIFPGCRVWQQLREDKQTPRVLEAFTDWDMIDLNILADIEGVSRVTPVIRTEAELAAEDAKMRCQIQGVYASYLDGKFTQGGVFPDGSTMPFLVLNEAAAKAFLQEDGRNITVDAGTDIFMTAEGNSQKAQVCGVLKDGSETPAVYMSYDTARRILPQSGDTNVFLYLNHQGDSEKVIKALRKRGLTASAPEDETLRWELMETQYRMLFLISFTCILGSAMLTHERRKREDASGEAALLLSGMTSAEVSVIFPLRIVLTGVLSLSLAVVLAITASSFIPQGLIVSGSLTCVYCFFAFTIAGKYDNREPYTKESAI